MASQITHIPYGRKAREVLLAEREIDEGKFLIGTLFPDIRYLGTIERDRTHWEKPEVNQLNKIENDFRLGMHVHSLVDVERNRLIGKLGIDKQIPQGQMATAVLKIVEDGVVYPLVDDWDKVITYFDEVLEEELEFVSRETANSWHKKLQEYFAQPPSLESVTRFLGHLTLTEDQKAEAIRLFKELSNNQKIKSELSQIYDHLFMD